MRIEVFSICRTLIELRFQNCFRLIAQFYTLNLILFPFNRNIDKSRPFLAKCLLFFRLKSQKMRYLHCLVKFQLRKLGYALTWYENAVPQLRNCITLQLNQKVHCPSSAALQKVKKLNCEFCAALLLVEKIVARCCAALLI